MKLQQKIQKVRENYYLDFDLAAKLEKLSEKTKYTKTELVTIAIQNLLKENE